MKIVSLQVDNVKKIKAVSITPEGNMVVIGGENEQGKSTLLDSIQYALGGAKNLPDKPIRNGQESAKIVADLGSMVVTRTFTGKGSYLTVKNKDGAPFSNPQAMLDQLVGNLSFDPMAFATMDDKVRLQTLKKLVGLDFTAVDQKRKAAFDQRTEVNRQGKELKAQFEGMELTPNVPKEEVSVSKLSVELTDALNSNKKIDTTEYYIKEDQKSIEKLKEQIKELETRLKKNQDDLKKLKKIDTTAIQKQIENAEKTNAAIRVNKARDVLESKLEGLRKASQEFTEIIVKADEEKASMLEKAKFPIKGLSFNEDGVMFNDIPFDQCSDGQKIKISVAMGLAMNPELRVLLIRNGSLLDSKNLDIVAKMAAKADAQVWMERVGKGEECSIIIEDGSLIK